MDTAWLEVFRAVARHGSFTAAGAELGFTQSAVSRQIAAPEAEFGAPPSTGCHVAYGSPSRAATRSATPGPPSTGSPTPTADAALVPRALAAFAADHPGVHVTHVEGYSRDHVAALETGGLDLALVSGYPEQLAAYVKAGSPAARRPRRR